MKILAIETSCDETAISIIEADGKLPKINIKILSNVINSQAHLHEKHGGVYPTLAKREHSKNLIPVLKRALIDAKMETLNISNPHNPNSLLTDLYTKSDKNEYKDVNKYVDNTVKNVDIERILEREPELLTQFLKYIPEIETPDIDAIAVTYGPGLEPALWVGINFAKALSIAWDKPVIPVNHMEGHIFSALLKEKEENKNNTENLYEISLDNNLFPILSLLISGGHTELVLMNKNIEYSLIGETRDDASGEAFDKVARMLGLPYPGGPEISALAQKINEVNLSVDDERITLPRPMLNSNDFDFSFSGLKTAVLNIIKNVGELTEDLKIKISYEFQEASSDVLVKKTIRAVKKHGAKTVVLGGGVSANKRIRERISEEMGEETPSTELFLPKPMFTTDNALMIALAGYMRYIYKPEEKYTPKTIEKLKAIGTLRLGK